MFHERPQKEVIIPTTAEAWDEESSRRQQAETTGMHPVYSYVARNILSKAKPLESEDDYEQLFIPPLSRRGLFEKAAGSLIALVTADIFVNHGHMVDAAVSHLPDISYHRIRAEVKDGGIRPDAIYQGVVTISPTDLMLIKDSTGNDINFSYDSKTFDDVSIDTGRSWTVENPLIKMKTINHQKIPMMKFSISEGDLGGQNFINTVGFLKADFLMDEDPVSPRRQSELLKIRTNKDGDIYYLNGVKFVPFKGKVSVVYQDPLDAGDLTAVSGE